MSSSLDYIVIIVFSALILGIGFMFSRTRSSMKSFFAGGESVPWPISGLSLFMSFFSAGTFVAWGSIAYNLGWVSITIQWTMGLGALIVAFFIAPYWKKTNNLTAAEFIQERLGLRVQKLYVYVFMIIALFTSAAVLYPVGKLISTSMGLPMAETTVILGLIVIASTALGGLWAVMVTDVLQFVVLSAVVMIVLPMALTEAGGMSNFIESAPEDFFNLLNGEFTLWFVIAFIIYHIIYIGGNWTFVQRFTSVDSPKSASKVAYLFGALYVICPVIWMLPPMIYKTINPSLQGLDAENAYLYLCEMVLPAGLMGLMLTGMYFATAATANTTLNVISAVFTNDIYKSDINPNATEKQQMRIAKLSSWGLGILIIVIALLIPLMGGMVEVVLSIAAVTAGPLLAPPIWALFSKRLSGEFAIWITLGTLIVNTIFKTILPFTNDFSLSRAEEMMMGVTIPILLLIVVELIAKESPDYIKYKETKKSREKARVEQLKNIEEVIQIKHQNGFGLKVISFALLATSIILFFLSGFAASGKGITFLIGLFILGTAIVPYILSRNLKRTIEKLESNNK